MASLEDRLKNVLPIGKRQLYRIGEDELALMTRVANPQHGKSNAFDDNFPCIFGKRL